MSEWRLFEGLLEVSQEKKDIKKAILEWNLIDIYDSDESETCVCGHYPIKNVCVIQNKHNNEELHIGNCCVNHFNKELTSLINALRLTSLINALRQNRLNKKVITKAHDDGIINEKEYKFLCDVWRKRKPSIKQANWITHLKQRILKTYKGSPK